MDGMEKESTVRHVFERISDTYDGANRRISLGFQTGWKNRLLAAMLRHTREGDPVLDVCCGTGDLAVALAQHRRQAVGVDFSPAMLAVAEEKGRGLSGLSWWEGNAMSLPFETGQFSAACISFGLRNTTDYTQVLREMGRVVRLGGLVCCLDSFVPESPLIRPFYRLYFQGVMPILGGGRRKRKEYQWLWQSTQAFVSQEELAELFRRSGLAQVSYESYLFGTCALHMGVRPPKDQIQTDAGGI